MKHSWCGGQLKHYDHSSFHQRFPWLGCSLPMPLKREPHFFEFVDITSTGSWQRWPCILLENAGSALGWGCLSLLSPCGFPHLMHAYAWTSGQRLSCTLFQTFVSSVSSRELPFLFLSPTFFFHRKDCLVIVFNISSLFLFTFLCKALIKSRLSISASLISTFTFHYFMYQHLKERKIQIHISENPREEKTRQIWLCQYWFRFKCLRRSKSRFKKKHLKCKWKCAIDNGNFQRAGLTHGW